MTFKEETNDLYLIGLFVDGGVTMENVYNPTLKAAQTDLEHRTQNCFPRSSDLIKGDVDAPYFGTSSVHYIW